MWRYWNELPAKGQTGIVFGSWYTALLKEARRKKPRHKVLEAHWAAIQRFEALLAAEGVQIVKLWFHLSAQAQQARITSLLASPETAWKVTRADRKAHKKIPTPARRGSIGH